MRTIICKKCGAPIDADLGECPICGAVYYILPEDDSTRVWDAQTAATAAEIHAALASDEDLDATRPVPPVEEELLASPPPPTPQPQRRPVSAAPAQNRPAPQQRSATATRQPPTPKRNKTWMYIVIAVSLLAMLTLVLAFMSGAFNFGGEPIEMPHVVGLDRDIAVNQLKTLGISSNVIYEESEQARNTVISQSVLEGKTVDKNTKVTLTVSSGVAESTPPEEDFVDLPEVVGEKYEVAAARLEGAGFKVVRAEDVFSETDEAGTVVRQSPLSGALLKKGDTVTLTVSKGKELKEFSVIITAGKGGKAAPNGSVTVEEGEDLEIVFTPDEGYELVQLRINGEDVGVHESYTLKAIDTDYSVYAVFAASKVEESDPPSAPPETDPPETDAPETDAPETGSPDGDSDSIDNTIPVGVN